MSSRTARATRSAPATSSGPGSARIHAFYETKGNTVLWLETSAPGPPDRHSYRFERDWEYLSSRLQDEAAIPVRD